ncbi:MAG: HAD hydrolase family protein [Deltaproteobacteria bacterium]|nr:HAD hydrolase family protein [Deltaproteobacteria bacterium]
MPNHIKAVAATISLVILDVDGVLTDGTLAYTESGERVKNFNAKDGLGIRLMQSNNIEVAVITARQSPPLAKRMQDLRIEHFYTGYDNKLAAFEMLLEKVSFDESRIAYVGDDILDLPVMRRVALPIAVGDAHFTVKDEAKWTVSQLGGRGAVREVADGLIGARTDVTDAYNRFLAHHVGKSGLDKA